MSDSALILLGLVVTILGMAALSLTIDAHWQQVTGRRAPAPAQRLMLRLCGGVLLAASFALCAAADPLLMALLVWPMLLMVGAAIVAVALTVHAQSAKPAASPGRRP